MIGFFQKTQPKGTGVAGQGIFASSKSLPKGGQIVEKGTVIGWLSGNAVQRGKENGRDLTPAQIADKMADAGIDSSKVSKLLLVPDALKIVGIEMPKVAWVLYKLGLHQRKRLENSRQDMLGALEKYAQVKGIEAKREIGNAAGVISATLANRYLDDLKVMGKNDWSALFDLAKNQYSHKLYIIAMLYREFVEFRMLNAYHYPDEKKAAVTLAESMLGNTDPQVRASACILLYDLLVEAYYHNEVRVRIFELLKKLSWADKDLQVRRIALEKVQQIKGAQGKEGPIMLYLENDSSIKLSNLCQIPD